MREVETKKVGNLPENEKLVYTIPCEFSKLITFIRNLVRNQLSVQNLV